MTDINVLTYNMSWATQINKELGSEADFVKACKTNFKKGGYQCIDNAIKQLYKTNSNLDLIGLQEVNSSIEKKIFKSQKKLKRFERAISGPAIVSILWNPEIFGEVICKKSFNLDKDDNRPALILYTKKLDNDFLLINLHMPWFEKQVKAKKILNKELCNDKCFKSLLNNPNLKIIMTGDFNDPKTTINANSPLILTCKNKTYKLKYIKNKSQAKRTLKSCCWHEPGHKYLHFSDTGDYILVNKNLKQKTINIPKGFNGNKKSILYSDHKPVFSKIQII